MAVSTKLCPKCSEFNEIDTLFCKHCGYKFSAKLSSEPNENPSTGKKADKIIYQDQNVLISVTRYTVHNTTYTMKDITSVQLTEKPASRFIPIIIWIFALVQMFLLDTSLLGEWLFDNKYTDGAIIFVVGLIINSFIKDEFSVTITNLTGQIDTLKLNNKEYVLSVVNHLNQAIIERG